MQSRQVQDVVVVMLKPGDLPGLAQKLEYAISSGYKKFLVNMSNVPNLFGDGVEHLTNAQFKSEMENAVLAFCQVSPAIMGLLQSLGLDTFFPYIYPDENTALRELVGASVAGEEVPMTLEEVRALYKEQQEQQPPPAEPPRPSTPLPGSTPAWSPRKSSPTADAPPPQQTPPQRQQAPPPQQKQPPRRQQQRRQRPQKPRQPQRQQPPPQQPPARDELPVVGSNLDEESLDDSKSRRKFTTGRFSADAARAIQSELKNKLDNVDFDNLKLLQTSTELRGWGDGGEKGEEDFRAFVVSAFHSPKHLEVFEYLCLKTENPNESKTIKELKKIVGNSPLVEAACESLADIGILAEVKNRGFFRTTISYRLSPQQPNPARINRLIVMLRDPEKRQTLFHWIQSAM